MASYNFDVAFDWDALESSPGQYPLNIGLVTFSQPPQYGTQYYFQINDTFCINAYNQTSNASQASHSILTGFISFSRFTEKSANSPVGQAAYYFGSMASTGTGSSDAFPDDGACPNFCPVLGARQITTQGDFKFKVSLTVQSAEDGTTKDFVIDPEMIVQGPAGG
jgi:hypothetical protein